MPVRKENMSQQRGHQGQKGPQVNLEKHFKSD